MVETVWGALGKWTTAAGFLAMTVSLMVAYIGGAGELAAQALFQGCGVTSSQASVAFAAAAGLTLGSGYRLCEKVNQGLVLALIASFIAITVTGLPNLHISFLQYANWHQVFPKNISIGLVAFLSQGTVPTILSLFQGNVSKARKAILWGNTIPLIVYALWEAVALGEVPHSEGQLTAAAFLSMLGSMNGPLFSPAIQVFSLCAISSSAIGVGLSVSDTISDIFRGKLPPLVSAWATVSLPPLASLTLGKTFTVLLENIALLGSLLLFGVLPALLVLDQPRTSTSTNSNEATRLGQLVPYGMLLASGALAIPESGRLIQSVIPVETMTATPILDAITSIASRLP